MKNHEKDNDNGHSMINELKWTLNGYSNENRHSFINHLFAANKIEIASVLIPEFGNIAQKKRLRSILIRKLIFYNKKEKCDYLLVSILQNYKQSDKILIRLYFFVVKGFNSKILKELYKLNKELFLNFFNMVIRKMNSKSYEMTVFFRDDEIKDFLKKYGDRKILSKVQMLDSEIRLKN